MERGDPVVASIDSRIVQMSFEGSKFITGIQGAISNLGKLKGALDMTGATRGLQQVDAAAKRFSLGGISNGIDAISAKFSALTVVGITAITNLTNRAVNAGLQFAKAFTIDPIKSGLSEYETQLNSVQTILANTQSKGSTLKDVNGALNELNTYADKTIYNFAEMSRNIGTFTAAGVDLKTSTESIKGIANLAALSGSNSQQASTAMYQLSQAIAAGKVGLQDWNSVVNAGMGGEVFQTALKETARASGVAIDDIIKKNGSFRESLQEGWITAEIMTKTLSKFTGDLTDEQLKSMGYTAEQIADIQKLATTASDAATKVKTMSQLLDTLKEAAQSGWAQSWQIIFGDFEEAKVLFTDVSNVLGDIIGKSADSRNKLLQGWKDLGGRTAIIDAIRNAFNALMAVIKPIKEAFEEIFPPLTAKQLYEMSLAVKSFSEKLKISGPAAENLKRTFKGLFAAADIGLMVLKGLAIFIGKLVSPLLAGSGGLLAFTGSIGDWIVGIRDALKSGKSIESFFSGLGDIISAPIKAIVEFVRSLVDGFSKSDEAVSGFSSNVTTSLSPMAIIAKALVKLWSALLSAGERLVAAMGPLGASIADILTKAIDFIAQGLELANFESLMAWINTGALVAFFLWFKKFTGDLIGLGENLLGEGSFIGGIKEIFSGLSDTLGAMQTNLKAGALQKIAIAIGILAVSLLILSFIDADKLARSLAAITVMFTQLGVALLVFEKIAAGRALLNMPAIAAGLILLAGAILLLTLSVAILGNMDPDQLTKGLIGVGSLLAGLAIFSQMVKVSKGSIGAAVGMIFMALAVKVLASAVKDFGEMSTEEIIKGLSSVLAVLTAITIFMNASKGSGKMIATALGILILGAAMKVLASALKDFSSMSLTELGTGLGAMAASLLLISVAMRAMPKSMLVSAVSLVIVAASLKILAGVLASFAGMSWEEIAKGLVTLAGSLVIIGLSMMLMTSAIAGAAALAIVAASLALLGPVLLSFGAMDWGTILKSLAMLAGVFVVIGLAGLILTPIVPTLLLLGAAIALIGVGMLAAGAGLMAFSIGLTTLAAGGAAIIGFLVTVVKTVIGLIPYIIQALGEALILLAQVIVEAAPAIGEALGAILNQIVNLIATYVPIIINLVISLIDGILKAIADKIPSIVQSGFDIILGILKGIRDNIQTIVEVALDIVANFLQGIANGIPNIINAGVNIIVAVLNGIANNIGRIVTAATDVIVNFINGISNNLGRVIQAGVDLVINVVNGVANGIESNSARMGEAGGKLAVAIIKGMVSGIKNGAKEVIGAAGDIASSAIQGLKDKLNINSPSKVFAELGGYTTEGFVVGLKAMDGKVATASSELGNTAISSMKKAISDVPSTLPSDFSYSPTIKPVLDLTKVAEGSKDLDQMLSRSATANVSYSKAQSIAEDKASKFEGPDAQAKYGNVYNFNQVNNSPKSLSTDEIYRQTRNQFSKVKKELPV